MKKSLKSNKIQMNDSDTEAKKEQIQIAERAPNESDEEYQKRFYEELKELIKMKITEMAYKELLSFIQRQGALDAVTKRCIRIMAEEKRKLSSALTDIEIELEGRS